VRGVFDSVAGRYDLMNDLMSFGVHRLWKRFAVELAGVRAGHRVLDLASGTGDLADRFADLVGPDGQVVMSDINAAMLGTGRDRMIDRGHAGNLAYAQIDAERLPFPEDTFDLVTIAFGLRNVTDKQRALGAMFDALRPGGRALILEFSGRSTARSSALRPVLLSRAAAHGRPGRKGLGQLPLPRGVDPDAPRPGDTEGDDGDGGFRALRRA
jgi:demethylmenaquinone methyltransferase / 2-methoxy-6-polyprenyl-1,4-benzoquinol methylase